MSSTAAAITETSSQEDVAAVAVEQWSRTCCTPETESTSVSATLNRLKEVVAEQAAELCTARMDMLKLNETVDGLRCVEIQVQHLRVSVRELRADNSYLRGENQRIHQELVTSSGQYLTVLQSIESDKAVLDAHVAQFQRAEQVYEEIHKDIKDTLKHLHAQLDELRDEGSSTLLPISAIHASPREQDAPTEPLPPQLPLSFAPLVPPVATPFSYAVSLGGGCFVARTMHLNGFRCAAGPFDYMVATPALVAHCLDDNFRSYLDKDQLRREHGGWGHNTLSSYADASKHGAIFQHYRPDDWNETLPRRVERFRQVVSSTKRKLFVLGNKTEPEYLEDVRMVKHKLIQYGCDWFDLLVLNVVAGCREDHKYDRSSLTIDVREIDRFYNRIIVCTLHCCGDLRGANFQAAADRAQLKSLFQRIPANLDKCE